jgi:excinuclease UvrABC ATPase subunit
MRKGNAGYVRSLSAYARQFLDQMEKPDVDFIEGLSPAIAIEQRSAGANPGSTIRTRLKFTITCGPSFPQSVNRMIPLPAGPSVVR